jgi:ELWxxDGT repeat protein
MKKLSLFLLLLLNTIYCPAQTAPQLVKDITVGSQGDFMRDGVDLNGKLLFAYGDQLWITDGTEPNTVFLKAFFSISNTLTVIGSKVYFVADDSIHGNELWVTDGTTSGTIMVKDINPNGRSIKAQWGERSPLCLMNGKLYFAADDGVHGFEPWYSDGTTNGTQMLKDINPSGSGIDTALMQISTVNDVIYFTANDNIHGEELWASDGSPANTQLVRDLDADPNGLGPYKFMPYATRLVFLKHYNNTATDTAYITDGTTAGTQSLGAITGDFPSFNDCAFRGDRLYFLCTPIYTGPSILYVTSGWNITAVDTTSVQLPSFIDKKGFVSSLINYSELLFYAGRPTNGSSILGLRENQGSGTGFQVPYVGPDTSSSFLSSQLTIFGGKIYFRHATHQADIWLTNGLSTQKISAIDDDVTLNPYIQTLLRCPLVQVGNSLYFTGYYKTDVGPELYKIDLFPANVTTNQATKTELNIYPNPAKDVINIDGTGSITIYDIWGRIAYTENLPANGHAGLNITKWATGIYTVITIENDGNRSYSKFIKE